MRIFLGLCSEIFVSLTIDSAQWTQTMYLKLCTIGNLGTYLLILKLQINKPNGVT